MIWRYPLMTMRVSWGIYRQALSLRRKGVPVYAHPAATETGDAEVVVGQGAR